MISNKPFLTIPRRDAEERPVQERIHDYKKTAKEMTKEQITEQATRCMNCGVPFCHAFGCPLLNVVPEIIPYKNCRGILQYYQKSRLFCRSLLQCKLV